MRAVKSSRVLIAVALLAMGLGLAVSLWPDGAQPTPPPVPTLEEVSAPAQIIDAAVQRAPIDAAPSTAPTLGAFQEGFCAPEGDETIKTTRVLSRLLAGELNRRQLTADPSIDAEETQVLTQAFEPSNPQGQRAHLVVAQRLGERLPNSVWPQLLIAMLGKSLHEPQLELTALRRARTLLPRDPAVGLALALATRTAPDLDEPIAGLDDYLAAENTPGFARIRARLEVQRDIQRGFSRRSRGTITLLWPPESLTAPQADDLLLMVDTSLDDATRLIGASTRPPLTVVVYPGRSELLAVSCVPTWAGGLYDGVLRLIASPDPLGVRPRTVRHETLHARLTPYAPNAPKWFHEGVAQSFAHEANEVRGQWALMVRTHVWVPFESLDGTFGVLSAADAHLAYAQSLALVDFITDTCGGSALSEAINAFNAGATTSAALAKACHRDEVTGPQLLEYLERRLSSPEPTSPATP